MAGNMGKWGGRVPAPAQAPGISKGFVWSWNAKGGMTTDRNELEILSLLENGRGETASWTEGSVQNYAHICNSWLIVMVCNRGGAEPDRPYSSGDGLLKVKRFLHIFRDFSFKTRNFWSFLTIPRRIRSIFLITAHRACILVLPFARRRLYKSCTLPRIKA